MAKLHDKLMNRIIEGKLELGDEEKPEIVDALKGQDIEVNSINATGKITGGEIVENMVGYSAELQSVENIQIDDKYCGVVKNGNKLTLVFAVTFTITDTITSGYKDFLHITIPSSIGEKLYPAYGSSVISRQDLLAVGLGTTNATVNAQITKQSDSELRIGFSNLQGFNQAQYYARIEATFLLSENLISQNP